MDLYESLSHPDTMTLQEMLDSDIKVEFDDSDIKVEFDNVMDHPDLADLGHGIDFGKELAKLEEAQTLDAHLDSDMDDLHNTWLNSSSNYNNMDFDATGLMVNPSTVVPTTISCPVSFGAFQNISLVSSGSSVTSIINGIELSKGKKLEQCTVASALSELPSVKVPSILPSSGIQVHYAKTVPRNQENASGNVTVNINDLQNAPQRNKKSHASAVLSEGQKPFPKPAYSYSCLIAMALKNSNTGSLPVSEIYNFMCEHFPYFKTAPNGWKNSVRHNLSLNKCFEKIEKPASNGSQKKGCLWAMNPDKITKMDEEVLKWSRKDPLAIKQAMAYPDNLEFLERGEMKINYKPRHESGSCSLDSEEEEFDSGSLESIHHEIKIENDDEPGIEKVTIDNAQLLNGSSSTTLEFVDIQGNSAIIEALSSEQLSALQSLTAQGGEVITTISSADVSNLLQNNHVLTTGLIPTTLLLQNNNDELKAYVKSELKHPVSA